MKKLKLLLFLFAVFTTIGSFIAVVHTEQEKKTYKTNINSEDSDKDATTNPNDNSSSILKVYKSAAMAPTLQKDAHIMWYVGKTAGIASFIMFTLVICMGLLMTSKLLLKFPFLSAPNALEAHSFNASFIALTLLVIHFVSFMFDDIVKLKLHEILVPFAVGGDIKSAVGWKLGLPISLGIIAMYLSFVLVVTSRLRKKIVPLKVWRAIHYSSFLFYLTFLFHGIMSGSDSKETWMITIYVTSVVSVVSLLMLRIFGKKYFIASVSTSTIKSGVNQPQESTNLDLPLINHVERAKIN
ncbi:hypothetical protein HYV31_01600 [candidate division WWE3 bacterium]|nr:hypothetical protein [candidate division WWE3 bacterium]